MTTGHSEEPSSPLLLAALFGEGSLEEAVAASAAPQTAQQRVPRDRVADVAPGAGSVDASGDRPSDVDGVPAFTTNRERGDVTDEGSIIGPGSPFDAEPFTFDQPIDPDPSSALSAGDAGLDTDLLLQLTDELPDDPLASADAVLTEHGIGAGHDLRDILSILPAEMLTPRLLRRCLPGLAPRWPDLRLLIIDALHAAGCALAPDVADAVTPLLDECDQPPPTIAAVEPDPLLLFWHEVSALRLLRPDEQRLLGTWAAEGRLVREHAATFEAASGDPPTADQLVALLVADVQAAWALAEAVIPSSSNSAAASRAALTAIGECGTPDSRIAELADALKTGDETVRATARRLEAALRTLPDDVLVHLCDELAVAGRPSGSTPTISCTRSAFIREAIERGRAAERVMLRHNLRLVLATARRYAYDLRTLELGDLVQEGSIGLQRAIEKWEPARGYAFSTYATWWIKQAITRAVADSDLTIRLPVHIQERTWQPLKDAALMLSLKGDERFLSAEDEATLLRLVTSTLAREECRQLLAEIDLSIRARDAVVAAHTIEPLMGETRAQAEQLIDECHTDDPEAAVIQESLTTVIRRVLSTLTQREQEVMGLRYGLDDDVERTLEEIGRRFSVTRERIRQIEARALRRLRHPSRSHAFGGFVIEPDLRAAADSAKYGKRRGRRIDSRQAEPANRSPVLQESLGLLGPEERVVMRYRLGLHDGRCWSRQQVAERMNLPLQIVERLENNALTEISDLAGMLDGELAVPPRP